MLATILLLTIISLALSVCLTPLVRGAAIRWRLVDEPDNNRKVHRKPLPRLGGVAVFAAYFGACGLVAVLSTWTSFSAGAALTLVKTLAPAAVLVFLIGLLDDLIGLKPWHKLAVEIAAGILAVSAGVSIGGVPILTVHPVIGAICTIAWLVLCTNAVNLIDGLDGLAAGIALMATLAAVVASIVYGNVGLAIAAAPLAGALLGFLVFNFNPASIFLGDGGSLLIGFLLGCYAILWSGHSGSLPQMAAPMIALAVPLADTTLAILRRFLRAQPIFSPDRSHIHHRLLLRGLTHRRAVLVLYIAAAIAGALSVCLIAVGRLWEPIIIAVFAAGAVFAVQRLGYAELQTAGKILTCSAFRREIVAKLAVRNFRDKLQAAATLDECWRVIQETAHEFGFHPIRMHFGGQTFVYEKESVPIAAWALRIPIVQDDWIELFHDLGPVTHESALLSFAESIRTELNRRRDTMNRRQPASLITSPGVFQAAASIRHHA